MHSVRVQLGEHECVDLALGPLRVGSFRGQLFAERLKGPPAATLLDRSAGSVCAGSLTDRFARLAAWIGRTAGNPHPKILNHAIRQFPGWRHLEHWIEIAQSLQQQAGVRIARHKRRACRPTREQAIAAVNDHAAHGLRQAGRMAAFALFDQHRSNAALEELDLWALRQRRQGTNEQQRRQSHASNSRSTVPCTSVRRKSRPA